MLVRLLAPHLKDLTPKDGRRLNSCLYIILLSHCEGRWARVLGYFFRDEGKRDME